MFGYSYEKLESLELFRDCIGITLYEVYDFFFDSSKNDNPVLSNNDTNHQLYRMLLSLFGSLAIYDPDNGFDARFRLYPTLDESSLGGLSCSGNVAFEAVQKLNKELLNINNYIVDYGKKVTNQRIVYMICEGYPTKKLNYWRCEVFFEGTSEKSWFSWMRTASKNVEWTLEDRGKKGWFYIQNETHVAWAIMIVFAYRDKTDLLIEIDEKTGEILDVFMFSPIEGITL